MASIAVRESGHEDATPGSHLPGAGLFGPAARRAATESVRDRVPLREAIEQRAAAFEVSVDSRVERGRTYRHALRCALEKERFDRVVIVAGASDGAGFTLEDIAWLLANTPGEILVLGPPRTRGSFRPKCRPVDLR